MKLFNDKEIQFIKNNVYGKSTYDLTKMFNDEFNKNLSVKQIQQFKKTNKIKSGVDCRFKKNIPPHNYKHIGDEFISKNDGYTYIKIGEPNKWEQKQRYLYKKYKGNIPKNCSVIFADTNKQNFNLDNLILVENRNKLVMKNKHLFSSNKQITQTGILIAKVMNKTYDIRKEVL